MPCQCKTDKQRAKCVWWIGPESGLIETNQATGEVRVVSGCFTEVALRWMRNLAMTDEINAAATTSLRNVIASSTEGVIPILDRIAQAAPSRETPPLIDQSSEPLGLCHTTTGTECS